MHSISVVIPTYNCAKYIGSAIQSVLKQTIRDDIQIIVVDDGSTDETRSVLQPYMTHIVYVYQENKGLPVARNRGIAEASGEYVAFLDADDRWRENKLEIQVQVLSSFPFVHVVFSDFSIFDEDGNKEESYFLKAFPFFHEYNFTLDQIFQNISKLSFNHMKSEINLYYGQIARYLFCGNFILPSSVMIRRCVIEHLGGFNESYRVAEETEFFLRICTVYNAAYIDLSLVDYLIKRTGKLTANSNMEYLVRNAVSIQNNYIKEHPDIYGRNRLFYDKAIANTYARLSYYLLTMTRNRAARLEARRSISCSPRQVRAYSYWLLSFLPPFLLVAAGKLKHSLRGNLRRLGI